VGRLSNFLLFLLVFLNFFLVYISWCSIKNSKFRVSGWSDAEGVGLGFPEQIFLLLAAFLVKYLLEVLGVELVGVIRYYKCSNSSNHSY
jgi:hypothetical protein